MRSLVSKAPVDRRRLVAFGSDLSLLSQSEYDSIRAPTSLRTFPEDLGNKKLEYSGIYEDGWISERAFFVLSSPPEPTNFLLKGLIPELGDSQFKTSLEIKFGGKETVRRELPIGNFDIQLQILLQEVNRYRIDLAWSNFQRLPGEDGRAVAAKLGFIGFEPRHE